MAAPRRPKTESSNTEVDKETRASVLRANEFAEQHSACSYLGATWSCDWLSINRAKESLVNETKLEIDAKPIDTTSFDDDNVRDGVSCERQVKQCDDMSF